MLLDVVSLARSGVWVIDLVYGDHWIGTEHCTVLIDGMGTCQERCWLLPA